MTAASEIRELHALHTEGILSDSEFEAAKRQILSGASPTRASTARPPRQMPAPADLSDLTDFYRRAFDRFDANGGRMVGSWNWPAFLFGAFWYLYKGMWTKALILITLSIFTLGWLWLPLVVYCGICGNYDYYLLRVRGTQLWEEA